MSMAWSVLSTCPVLALFDDVNGVVSSVDLSQCSPCLMMSMAWSVLSTCPVLALVDDVNGVVSSVDLSQCSACLVMSMAWSVLSTCPVLALSVILSPVPSGRCLERQFKSELGARVGVALKKCYLTTDVRLV